MYKVGDIIEQRHFCGGSRFVLVQDRRDDIKNGRPGFGGIQVTEDGTEIKGEFGSGVWGYDIQVGRVVQRA